MQQALGLARQASAAGEVPVGALIIKGQDIIAGSWNRPIGLHDPSAHAEMLALRAAGQALGNYRLTDTTLYVTLEPCAMCTAAIVHARVARVVYGAADPKSGALGGAFQYFRVAPANHRPQISGGVLADECGQLLRAFFQARR